jgi:hypothetical protein
MTITITTGMRVKGFGEYEGNERIFRRILSWKGVPYKTLTST